MLNKTKLITCYALISILLLPRTSAYYDANTCCNTSRTHGAFIGAVPPPSEQICGQSYSTNLPAARPLYVSYAYCAANCAGIGLSRPDEPAQWATPIVQFILPAVIFSMSIPRQKKIAYEALFDWPVRLVGSENRRWRWVNGYLQLARSMVLFTVVLVPVVVDTLIWIFIIVVGAAHMLVGGLFEAHLDYRIVKYVMAEIASDLEHGGRISRQKMESLRELLVTVASGNLVLNEEDGCPQRTIPASLTLTSPAEVSEADMKSRARLLNLIEAQYSFGSAVGSPVIFYLGGFVYTILDLQNNRSNEDSAIGLSFGMEWMIIVHVAIVSGCLLASNNPSTSSGIVGGEHEALSPHEEPRRGDLPWFFHRILGWSDAYATEFQPVSLWSRGVNKMKWIRASAAWNDLNMERRDVFRNAMHISIMGWFFKIFALALLMVAIPPATGGIVAYLTPPNGFGCRSISFMVYACCQFALTIIATTRNAVEDGSPGEWRWNPRYATWPADVKSNLQWLLTGYKFKIVCGLFWLCSMFASVGGTTMQITGVYRNCVCYAGADSWWDIRAKNPSIQLATDTQDARDSASYWISVGSAAMIFMALNCYVGWWYQRLVRQRFTKVVQRLAFLPIDPEVDGDVRPVVRDHTRQPTVIEPQENDITASGLSGYNLAPDDQRSLRNGQYRHIRHSSADSTLNSIYDRDVEMSNEDDSSSIPLLERTRQILGS